MWIIPKNSQFYRFVRDTEVSNSDWPQRYKDLLGSLLWRSKPTLWRTWSVRLNRVSWLSKLCTRTLKHSQRKDFEDALITSLRATRASRSVLPVNDKEKTTLGISGRLSKILLARYGLFAASLKTWQDISTSDSILWSEIWTILVTQLRRDCLRRRKLALRTNESDCSSWRTPNGSDGEGGIMENLPGKDGHYKLRDQVTWETPTVSTGGYTQADGTVKPKLDQQVKNWPTPDVMNKEVSAETAKKRMKRLKAEGRQTGGTRNLHQVVIGQPDQASPNTTGKNRGQLNPDWVCSLQGIFPFWTDLYLTPTDTTVYNGDLRVKDYEAIREMLQVLSKEVGTQAIQWQVGRFWYFFTQEILQSAVLCQGADARGCREVGTSEKSKQVSKENVPGVRYNETTPDSPLGWEYQEQLKRELTDFVCKLSCKMALESWEKGIGKIKQNMFSMWRNRPYSPWDVSNSLSESKEIWKSASNEEVGQWVMGACKRYLYWQESHKASPIRVDQLRLLGNGVVRQCAEKAIRELIK